MSGVNNRPPDPARVPFEGEYHKNKRAFRATGKGLMVNKPDNANIKLDEYHANGLLATTGQDGGNPEDLKRQYLFVDGIKTSYNLAGSIAQSQDARTFYPRNMTQTDLIITGTMPNQYEYDKLVVFVNEHQKDIVINTDIQLGTGIVQVKALDFTYVRPAAETNVYEHGPKLWAVQLTVAISAVKAGHERFKFAPAFTLTCKILDDKLYGLSEGEDAIIEVLDLGLDYYNVYGTTYHPTPREEPNFAMELSTQRPRGVGTAAGGGGGGDYSPGTPDKYADKIAAGAPGLSDPEKGNPIKAKFSGCVPLDPGKQYFGQWADEARVFGPGYEACNRGHDGMGPHVHVKFRNPPSGGNTIGVLI